MTSRRQPSVARVWLSLLLLATAAIRAQEDRESEVLGKPSGIAAGAWRQETIRLEAGTLLLARPERRAPTVLSLDSAAEIPLLARREGWAQVRYESRKGWVLVDPDAADLITALGDSDGALADPERLARARSFLRGEPITGRLGPWSFVTDIEDTALVGGLAATAEDVLDAYRNRFGLEPGSPGGETIVVFSSEEDYRRFEREVSQIGGLGTLGHMSGGIVATFAGERSADAIRQILVHELTHLVNRQTLADDLPPWLEEGMADDLAFSAFDESGRLLTGSLGGTSRIEGGTEGSGKETSLYLVDLVGPHGALFGLLSEWNQPERPSLEALIELPWAEFVQPDRRRTYYAESAFFVRFLMDGLRGGLADAFRSYLAATAAGTMAEGSTIWDYLGVSGAEIERPLYTWLRSQATANGIPLPTG